MMTSNSITEVPDPGVATTGSLSPSSSMALQAEKRRKRRAGKKEQIKRQHRQAREQQDQRLENDNTDRAEPPAFEVRRAGTKGLGLFATRVIEAGERINEEPVLFKIPNEDVMNESIIKCFVSLSLEQQTAFLGLSSHATCSEKQKSGADEKCTAEDGAIDLTIVGDPETLVDENRNPAEQNHRRRRASDTQHFPTKDVDSRSHIQPSCKIPNPALGSGDQSLKEQSKIEATPNTLDEGTGDDCPTRDSDDKFNIWNYNEMTDALEMATIEQESDDSEIDLRMQVNNNNQDMCGPEMTETLAVRIIDTWRTNSYMLDDGLVLDYAGIGLTAARLNHSCVPNVYTAYNSTSGSITVQAVRRIAAGEELCTSYINGASKLRSERRAQLSKWGFECTCTGCADGNNETRRKDIKSLQAKVEGVRTKMMDDPTGLTPDEVASAAGDLLELVTLWSDEKLFSPDLADV